MQVSGQSFGRLELIQVKQPCLEKLNNPPSGILLIFLIFLICRRLRNPANAIFSKSGDGLIALPLLALDSIICFYYDYLISVEGGGRGGAGRGGGQPLFHSFPTVLISNYGTIVIIHSYLQKGGKMLK